MVVAATIALIQLDSLKTGRPSFIAVGVDAVAVFAQEATAFVGGGIRGAVDGIADAPRLSARNAELREKNRTLRMENARLREALAQAPDARAIAHLREALESGTAATVVGYDPEALSRTVTLDRGSDAGVAADAGVIGDDGVIGRVISVTPSTSTVLLAVDGASKIPAIVQRGRWWGIAVGTNTALRLEYVSQDAKLKIGDVVVTGEGRSFHAGYELGTIARIDHPEGALYLSALVMPSVAFGRLSHALVLAR